MDVFCFDFDGVICDSAPETALSAWRACEAQWPGRCGEWSEALQQRFCRLRPVLHTGFEAIPLMRLILAGETDDDAILTRFGPLRDELMAREGLTAEALQRWFGQARDGLIAQDEAQWLRWNRFYPGLREILATAFERHAVFIITTKQERFVTLLLRHHELPIAGDRIFGLERKRSKPEILEGLLAHPGLEGAAFHFVEDRLETLLQVIETRALAAVRLYLADWGYNLAAQRDEAAASERIRVISRQGLRELVEGGAAER